jgi:hypothetical protein
VVVLVALSEEEDVRERAVRVSGVSHRDRLAPV